MDGGKKCCRRSMRPFRLSLPIPVHLAAARSSSGFDMNMRLGESLNFSLMKIFFHSPFYKSAD